jgi:hypothetical protein
MIGPRLGLLWDVFDGWSDFDQDFQLGNNNSVTVFSYFKQRLAWLLLSARFCSHIYQNANVVIDRNFELSLRKGA